MDMAAGNGFSLIGATVVVVGVPIVTSGFAMIIMFMAGFIRSPVGDASNDMAVTVFNGCIIADVVIMVSYFLWFFAQRFAVFPAHVSLPPSNRFIIIYVAWIFFDQKPKAEIKGFTCGEGICLA